jgi:hypothetical protein
MLLKNGLIPLITLLITLFIGCADDSITQIGNAVTVHLTNYYGFDYPTRSYEPNISIGNYPISITDENGRCSFTNIPAPYNVLVQGQGVYFSFKYLSLANPNIVAGKSNGSYWPGRYNECSFWANIQVPEYFHIVILRFISKDRFYEPLYDIITAGGSNNQFLRHVHIPTGVSSISGKLILMYCAGYSYPGPEGDDITEIYSFDSLAIRDITLHPGINDTITFSHQEISTNLHQSDVNYSVQSNYQQHTEACLSFPGYFSGSDILIFDHYWNRSFPVITDLPIPFEIKIRSVFGNSSVSLRPQVITKGGIGTKFLLQHKEIELLAPRNGITGVNDTTVFRFSDDIENGIYAIEIDGRYLTFTDRTEITFAELKNRAFVPERSSRYYWRVYKISDFRDINDFLSEPFNFSSKFSRISVSGYRGFYIAE